MDQWVTHDSLENRVLFIRSGNETKRYIDTIADSSFAIDIMGTGQRRGMHRMQAAISLYLSVHRLADAPKAEFYPHMVELQVNESKEYPDRVEVNKHTDDEFMARLMFEIDLHYSKERPLRVEAEEILIDLSQFMKVSGTPVYTGIIKARMPSGATYYRY